MSKAAYFIKFGKKTKRVTDEITTVDKLREIFVTKFAKVIQELPMSGEGVEFSFNIVDKTHGERFELEDMDVLYDGARIEVELDNLDALEAKVQALEQAKQQQKEREEEEARKKKEEEERKAEEATKAALAKAAKDAKAAQKKAPAKGNSKKRAAAAVAVGDGGPAPMTDDAGKSPSARQKRKSPDTSDAAKENGKSSAGGSSTTASSSSGSSQPKKKTKKDPTTPSSNGSRKQNQCPPHDYVDAGSVVVCNKCDKQLAKQGRKRTAEDNVEAIASVVVKKLRPHHAELLSRVGSLRALVTDTLSPKSLIDFASASAAHAVHGEFLSAGKPLPQAHASLLEVLAQLDLRAKMAAEINGRNIEKQFQQEYLDDALLRCGLVATANDRFMKVFGKGLKDSKAPDYVVKQGPGSPTLLTVVFMINFKLKTPSSSPSTLRDLFAYCHYVLDALTTRNAAFACTTDFIHAVCVRLVRIKQNSKLANSYEATVQCGPFAEFIGDMLSQAHDAASVDRTQDVCGQSFLKLKILSPPGCKSTVWKVAKCGERTIPPTFYTLKEVTTPKSSFDHEVSAAQQAASTKRNRDILKIDSFAYPHLVFEHVGEPIEEFSREQAVSAFEFLEDLHGVKMVLGDVKLSNFVHIKHKQKKVDAVVSRDFDAAVKDNKNPSRVCSLQTASQRILEALASEEKCTDDQLRAQASDDWDSFSKMLVLSKHPNVRERLGEVIGESRDPAAIINFWAEESQSFPILKHAFAGSLHELKMCAERGAF